MTVPHENLDRFIADLAAGDPDMLPAEQVARLERVLDTDPRLAAHVAAQRPARDERLHTALEQVERPALPTAARWEGLWAQIEVAAPVAVSSVRRGSVVGVLRYWRPVAVAAACLLLAMFWKAAAPAADPWPLVLASNVEIDDLDVSEGATSFLVHVEGSGADVIWVLPDES
jgi:anti-sigma-K factor RskA